ncbi:MAG: hypothetical protein IJQ73_18510 [Kiritimatiellae bacterium]|nr:hypothetical protein [Kiritimatiellia bacterium]
MRTTLTLDDDISILLERRLAETGQTFKELVNSLLRGALVKKATACADASKQMHTPVFHGGTLLIGDLTSTAEMLAIAEGEDFKRFPGLRFENPTA